MLLRPEMMIGWEDIGKRVSLAGSGLPVLTPQDIFSLPLDKALGLRFYSHPPLVF